MEELKVCKCCGVEKEISEFDLSNTKKPISICKPCRRVQQQINNLSKLKTLNEAQSAKLKAAREYMAACEAATGFVTGGYSSRVGAVSTKVHAAAATISATSRKQKYEAAQKRRAMFEASGGTLNAPTLEMLESQSLDFLVDIGYTAAECYAVLDAEVNKELPLYDEIYDKLICFPGQI